jgi:hypothetical protein
MDMPKPSQQPQEMSNRGKVIGLAVAAVLIGLGWLLVQTLGSASRTQDCLMSGRTNCAPISTP